MLIEREAVTGTAPSADMNGSFQSYDAAIIFSCFVLFFVLTVVCLNLHNLQCGFNTAIHHLEALSCFDHLLLHLSLLTAVKTQWDRLIYNTELKVTFLERFIACVGLCVMNISFSLFSDTGVCLWTCELLSLDWSLKTFLFQLKQFILKLAV